jgi:hypothetical protein
MTVPSPPAAAKVSAPEVCIIERVVREPSLCGRSNSVSSTSICVPDRFRRPYDGAGPAGPGQLGAAGRVVGDQPGPDGGVQCGPQRGADPVQCRRRNW